MNVRRMCMNCMQEKLNEYGVCTACGKKENDIVKRPIHLPMRTILKGKYLIGKVIGEGGFGITYIGYDLALETCVAIKEFCPKQYVGREAEDGLTVFLYDEKKTEEFETEKEKFINEARRLAKFRNEQGVVSVLDYFLENGTSYIVMDYIDGITLKGYLKELKESGRFMNMTEVMKLFTPVMETLAKIHKENIIHRDISPENIMISRNLEKVYLIDFGTARNLEADSTLSVYYKSFYTPIEQKGNKLIQGPWTDVYALCATIYVCITGRGLTESTSRLLEEDIIAPHEYGVEISSSQEAALLKGLAVKPEDRIQSMEELMQALREEAALENETVPEKVEEKIEFKVEALSEPETTIKNSKVVKEDLPQEKTIVEETLKGEKVTEEEQENPKKGVIKGVVKFAIIVLAICIGFHYYLNRTYRKNNEDGTYDIVTLENGSMVKCDRYSSTGRRFVSATFTDLGDDYISVIDYYDDSGKLVGTKKKKNETLLEETEYLADGGTTFTQYETENTYTTYARDSFGELGMKNVIENGELTESYLYDWPKEGWWVHFIYELGDGSNDNYEVDYYDSNDVLVLNVVTKNNERVEYNIINQELYDSVEWE